MDRRSMIQQLAIAAVAACGVGRAGAAQEALRAPHFTYRVECLDSTGRLKWHETIENLVTTTGKNHALDTEFAGSSYTAAWFIGLVDNASFSAYSASDTMASHAGWLESVAYSNSTRVAPTFASASGGSKSTSSAASFSINGSATIRGCFVNSVSTKSGTTGTLYSAGDFSGGSRSVVNGDTLNVSLTLSYT